MEYRLGDRLRVDGRNASIIGIIEYRNNNDGASWFEYYIQYENMGGRAWLSIDDTYKEYSVSTVQRTASLAGYHQVDEGEEEVLFAQGNVDVERGDRAHFVEYEDSTEEKIISYERWDDGLEVSTGYYLDADEIEYLGAAVSSGNYSSSYQNGGTYSGGNNKTPVKLFSFFAIAMVFIAMFGGMLSSLGGSKPLQKFLEESTGIFTYVTSATGSNKQVAKTYKSELDIDATSKLLIEAIKGNTESVQQNTEDDDQSVAILTKNEYCLVYMTETTDEVYVQVSSRKYAYFNDDQPYRSSSRTHRYYRRFYHSRSYTSDASRYKGSSPYSGFSDSGLSSSSDSYSSYATSIRQTSTTTRTSDGGGTSFGK